MKKPSKPSPAPPIEEVAAPEEIAMEAPPPPKPAKPQRILRAEGTRFVDADGEAVILKGCNLGNWLLLEMWMLDVGDIQDQYGFEKALSKRFGKDEKERLMEIYRANWITERDFPIIRRFGMNVVRVPFNYTLLEDPDTPFRLRRDAFKWLDWVVEMGRKYDLYVILDMHGLPGGQSMDHTTGRAGQNRLWSNEENQQRTAWLWKRIAERYADSPVVAAYDIVNEPFGDGKTPKHEPTLIELADLVYRNIRSVDTNHVILLAGTHRGIEFYGKPADRGWQNVGFTEHFYPGLFGSDPTLETHAHFLSRTLPARESYLRTVQAPYLIGEFNVVLKELGGAALMRHYYDAYGRRGWAATMWAYKLVNRKGGMPDDSWCMVKNRDPLPQLIINMMSQEDVEAWFRWLGQMEYSCFDNLGAALTMKEPPPVALPEFAVLPTKPPAQDDPSPWQGTDISNALPGGQRVYSPSAMDIYGGGADIWEKHDQFRFVWQEVGEQFELTATLTNLAPSHVYAKAGLMLRASLEPDSPHVLFNAFPDGGILVAWRRQAAETTEQKMLGAVIFPVQLRMRRDGRRLELAYSVGEGKWRKTQVRLSDEFGPKALAGMAVMSHTDSFLTSASFEGVSLRQ